MVLVFGMEVFIGIVEHLTSIFFHTQYAEHGRFFNYLHSPKFRTLVLIFGMNVCFRIAEQVI